MSTPTDTPLPYTTLFLSYCSGISVPVPRKPSNSPLAESTGRPERRITTEPSLRSGETSMPLKALRAHSRSEEHTSELQSLIRSLYAELCLKKNKDSWTVDHQKDTKIQWKILRQYII